MYELRKQTELFPPEFKTIMRDPPRLQLQQLRSEPNSRPSLPLSLPNMRR